MLYMSVFRLLFFSNFLLSWSAMSIRAMPTALELFFVTMKAVEECSLMGGLFLFPIVFFQLGVGFLCCNSFCYSKIHTLVFNVVFYAFCFCHGMNGSFWFWFHFGILEGERWGWGCR